MLNPASMPLLADVAIRQWEFAQLVKKGVEALPESVRQTLYKALNPVRLAPASASEAEPFEHYRGILESRGYALDPPTVLAIRGMSSDGTVHMTSSTRSYDDTIVVLTRDANGEAHVRVFAGATHPGQSTADIGGKVGVPDGNDDGNAAVGMIKSGEYQLEPRGNHNGAWAWNVRTTGGSGDLPGWRDTDQEGLYEPPEHSTSDAEGHTLDGVMIHQGAGDRPQSAGCINLSSNADVYPEFIEAIGGKQQSAKLVVMDADA